MKMPGKEYAYARISRPTQNITRQVQNILKAYPNAEIKQEAYTGTKIIGRKVFNSLIKQVAAGDTIIFDSVSRMSRNAEDGVETYFELYDKGVNLIFLKEPHINTDTYRQAMQNQIDVAVNSGDKATDKFISAITDAIAEYTKDLAKKQIELAFLQAEKEVTDLHQRTSEGLRVAKSNGKQIGCKPGSKLKVKKKEPLKNDIRRMSKDFQGSFNDKEILERLKISRNTYYKYKKELIMELQQES